MPTFTFEPLTATSYRVSDAHTGEAYGVINGGHGAWSYRVTGEATWAHGCVTRDGAATALYRARFAHAVHLSNVCMPPNGG